MDQLPHLESSQLNWDANPENAALLWYANEFQVMEDALTIFAILERGPAFASKEQRIKVPHPDGDIALNGECVELLPMVGSKNMYIVKR